MSQFVPTVTNMVNIVRNIIDSYGMGPGSIRALAQEPVQNSKDAARGHAHIEYRLHRRSSADGSSIHMLTVTDSGTTGLRGPALTLAEVQARGNVLRTTDNWAAFEGMGYSKEDDTALGSRGQGKAAFLYHSHLPPSFTGQDRMLILYDTLLDNGEYRLGVRYASPFDTVLSPPFEGDEARQVVSTSYATDDGLAVQLQLNPLTETGTRIIVPYLSSDALEAFHSGELRQWLQRCWWRAIQIGMVVNLVDEHGTIQAISVPSWWDDEPWRRPIEGAALYEDIDVGELKIKRIVLLYDENLSEPDIEGAHPQFWGVQLLRGQQWIETLGASDTLSGLIPPDKRPGFRGFVEFDSSSEVELRRAESSQHNRFDRRKLGVTPMIAVIREKVQEFAEAQGWSSPTSIRPAPDRERDAALEFLRFLSPQGRAGRSTGRGAAGSGQMDMLNTERWECNLTLDYPDPRTTRVNWGEYIRNINATVRLEPALADRQAIVALEMAREGDDASRVVVDRQTIDVLNGEGSAAFGDFRVITGAAREGQLHCPQPGKWRLTARVEVGGVEVKRSSRTMYVGEDPPPRSAKPYTLSISVENHTTGQRRINNGDVIGVQVSASNHTPDDEILELTASVGDLLLADAVQVAVQGTPVGASPDRVAGLQASIAVNPDAVLSPPRLSVDLPPGRHALRADLSLNGEVVAHASRTLDIEIDPAQAQDWPPFRIEQITGGPHPRWQFNKTDPLNWVLQYPSDYLLYRALGESATRNGSRLSGASALVVEVCSEGIIEWVMDPVNHGDESRLNELLDGAPPGANLRRWEEYCGKMRELAVFYGIPERLLGELDAYNHLARECASRAMSLYEERE